LEIDSVAPVDALSLAPILIPLVAAGYGLLLTLALVVRSVPKRAIAGLYAAGFLAVASLAMTLIALNHAGIVASNQFTLLIDSALILASGPLLTLFAGTLLVRPVRPFLLFVPLVLFLAAAILVPAIMLMPVPVDRLIFVQMAYTAWVGMMVVRTRAHGRRSAANRRLVLITVCAMGALHAAQLARTLFPSEAALTNIVPWVGALLFTVAAGAVFLGGRVTTLEPLTETTLRPTPEAIALAEGVDCALAKGLLKDPKLSLNEVAGAVGAPAEAIAKAVVATRGMSFAEHLLRLRIAEAKRLLGDPNEARTSMEAIGALAGFGSRSAFYKAFSDHVGMSPAAYRRDSAAEDVQNTESGQQSSL
jgi:AraC-like DNA-binding protein